jgi:hypothetical protein
VALGPAEVHPEEHLRPVVRLGPPGPGRDGEEGVPLVVGAREEEGGPLPLEVAAEGGRLRLELGPQLLVVGLGDQLGEGDELVGSGLQAAPGRDLGSEVLGPAEGLLGGSLVGPEVGRQGQGVEVGELALLRLEVKDAPRSTGSDRRARGRRRGPSLGSGSQILEQERPQLDEAEGGLAPGDDGVHAGTVAVVGTDAAISVAVEGGGVATGSTVSFAGDEIDEGRFLGLLHLSLTAAAFVVAAPRSRRDSSLREYRGRV